MNTLEAFHTGSGIKRSHAVTAKTISFDVTSRSEVPAGTVVEAAGLDGVFKAVNCLSGFLSNIQKIRLVLPEGNEASVCLTIKDKDGDFDAELCGELTSFNMELAYTNGLMRDCANEVRLGA